MTIRELTTKDAEKILSALRSCFSTPWSYDSIKELLQRENALIIGALEGDELLGYAVLEWILDEGSLTNIAVKADQRRQGIGERLLNRLVEHARERKLSFITLEVRASNIPAISLYRKYSFESVGRRPSYYRQPTEDAELMTLFLRKEEAE